MKRLFDALDVDYDQWLALTKVALKVDLRASTFVRGSRGRRAGAVGAFISQLMFYTVTGGFIAALVWFSGDLFLSATFMLGYVMFMVGTAALLDHNAAITSPDDYHILGFRPVTSRTYFAARLTNVLAYTLAMTTLFAYLPVVAYFLRWGPAIGAASLVAVYAASFLVALGMVTVYAWLLRVVGAARIKRLLSYLQFVLSFLVYGGYFFVSRLFSESMLATMTLPKTIWVLLLPPTWFASYLEIAAGRTSALEIVPAIISIAALAALGLMMGGRLSLDYADRLGAMSAAAPPSATRSAAKRRRSFWFRGGEARAISLLIRSQFANDMKFRMGVLAILPLTIIYLAMGISRHGTIGDPFLGGRASQGLSMVTLAMLMFPTMLKMNLGRSDAYRASWIFFATPTDRTLLVRAAKNVLVVTFLLPYLVSVAILLSFFTTNVPHLLVHLLIVGLVSHLVLQLVTFVDPELPFSKPMAKGRSSARVFVLIMVIGAGSVMFPLLGPVIYRHAWNIVAAVLTLVAMSAAMERLTRLRIDAQAAKIEFEG